MRACRHNLLIVQRWLLERCDAAMLLVPTKSAWLPLATACRAGNLQAAVAYLQRARELGMCVAAVRAGCPEPGSDDVRLPFRVQQVGASAYLQLKLQLRHLSLPPACVAYVDCKRVHPRGRFLPCRPRTQS